MESGMSTETDWTVVRVEGPFGLSFVPWRGGDLNLGAGETVSVAHPGPLDGYAAERIAKLYEERADRLAMADESYDPGEEGEDEF
jgi:hypothetical protein